ncbi:MAG: tetratricopeptide repeat protein [Thermodesulfobacteriota bacterium]|nr:tetratricopeptide repeat protein [Thermodesulfobacteriota bacterium]
MEKRSILHFIVATCAFILFLCPLAHAKTLRMGGDENRVRLVFELKYDITSQENQKGQTLIVNFPYNIGDSCSVHGFFIIDNLEFDGKDAVISMKGGFSYKAFSLKNPYRRVIDIYAVTGESLACPVEAFEGVLGKPSTQVVLYMKAGMFPEVRQSGDTLYLMFGSRIMCTEIKERIGRSACMELKDTIHMEKGDTLVLVSKNNYHVTDLDIQKVNNRIVVLIAPPGVPHPDIRLKTAQGAFEKGDVAFTISTLQPFVPSLGPQELILLARAYWKISWPYGDPSLADKAMRLMIKGVDQMSPGIQRERILLEYTQMLLHYSRFRKAMKYIRFLKDSSDDSIAAVAYIQEIDILNRKKRFDDAFVSYKRMDDALSKGIPSDAETYYLATRADTYLGLYAYEKAIVFYNKVIQNDPGYVKGHPGIYGHIADAYFFRKDYDNAQGYIMKAINLGDPEKRSEHVVKLGDCLYHKGEGARAVDIFSEVEQISPKSDNAVIAKLRKAHIMVADDFKANNGHLSDKVFYEALDIYRSIDMDSSYMKGPLISIVKIRVAQLYAMHKDWNESFKAYYKAWIDSKKDNPVHDYAQTEARKAMLDRMKILFSRADYDQIYELYTTYVDSFLRGVDDPETLLIIASSMHKLGHDDEARERLKGCVNGSPRIREKALALVFKIDLSQGLTASALEWNTQYLKGFPDTEHAEYMREKRGEILYRLGHYQQAIRYLSAMGEKDNQTLLDLADAYHRLGETDKEEQILNRVSFPDTGMDADNIEQVLLNRAFIAMEKGNYADARDMYNTFLKTRPKSRYRWWVIYHLSEIAMDRGKKQQAAHMLNRIMEGSQDPVLRDAAGCLLEEQGLNKRLREYDTAKNRFRGN